jgi:hypothetical protein
MRKNVDLKNRVVDMYDVDTGKHEAEIVSYLDRKMKVRFHSASFNNKLYVFLGDPTDNVGHSMTVNRYRKKNPGENVSIRIE